MERTLTNLKNLPALQLPTQTPKTVALPKIEAVPQLPRLAIRTQASYAEENRRRYAEQVAAAQAAKEESYKSLTGIIDPNDPYSVNSFADALFNRKGKEKRYGEFAEVLHKIPVLGDLITGVVSAVDTSIIRPTANVLTGDFAAFGINGLTNLSETLDVLANPVKALITPLVNQNTEDPKYQLPWYERLGAGFGFTEEGRYNYDYDTGFWLADLGLEIISDPLFILDIATFGGKSIAKNSAKLGAKVLSKEIGSEIAETAIKSSTKVLSKAGKEITEEVIQETVTKNFTKTVVNKTLSLRKLGNTISSSTKKLAKQTGDDALKVLAQNLDTAMASSKSITNDTINDIVNQITHLAKNKTKEDFNETSIKTLKELLQYTDTFSSTAQYSLKDFLLDLVGETADNSNKVLTRTGKAEQSKIWKAIKKLSKSDHQDPESLKKLSEQLEILFSDPYSIKKYKKTFNVNSFEELFDNLKNIPFTDYFEKANALIQKSNAFKFSLAMDQLAEGTKAVDKVIFKSALHSSAPLVPFVTKILKPQMATLLHNVADSTFGKNVINWLTKNIESVETFFRSKFGNATVLIYQDLEEAYRRVFKEFDLFSGSKLAETGFEKELAQSIYNDTFSWLRGYGTPSRYTYTLEQKELLLTGAAKEEDLKIKPINILNASVEEQRNQIVSMNVDKFSELGINEDQAIDYFFKELDKMGQLGFGAEPLKDWSISEYVSQLRITDALITARNAYKDFDEVLRAGSLESKSLKSILKYARGINTSLASPKGSLVQAKAIIDELKNIEVSHTKSLTNTIKAAFSNPEFKSKNRKINSLIASSFEEFDKAVNSAILEFQTLDYLKKVRAQDFVMQAQEDLCEDAFARLTSSSSKLKVSLLDYSKAEAFKSTPFAELYKHLQKISSPYYYQKYQTSYAINNYLEIAGSTRAKTLEILKNADFQELVTSLRTGEGKKLLNIAKQEVEVLAKQSDHAKNAERISNAVQHIENTLNYIDAYVEHLSLVKQSSLPEALQEIYLEVLEEMPVRDAAHFMQNFDVNASEVIHRMNEKLSGRLATQNYSQDYLATQLLEMEGFKTSAQKYLNSARTITDEVDFVEATYKAKVLPEYSKKVIDPETGLETKQYVYKEYNKYKDKQHMFLSFRTSGSNPSLNSISDLSFKCGDTRWVYDHTKDEITNLLDFYKQVKAVADKGETVFITYNMRNQDLDFLRNRMYELMEEKYNAGLGSPELLKEYTDAKLRKATPEELAEIQERMAQTVNLEEQHTFHNLTEAQQWFERNLYYTKLNCTDLLKKFDGVPTVGEYYYDIKDRFLMSYVRRQAANGGTLHLTLDDRFIDNLKKIDGFNIDDFQSTLNSIGDLFTEVKNYDNTLFARGENYVASGTMLIDGSFYKQGVRYTNTGTIDIEATTKANTVTVANTEELLNQNVEGLWSYKGDLLPKEITTANDALRYLKSKNPSFTYAPEWKAITPEQQLSTYPVLINGKLTLQQIEGTIPVTVKKYIDIPLVKSLFNIENAEGKMLWRHLKEQHHLTIIAEQVSEILNNLTDPRSVDEIASYIEELWNSFMEHLKNYQGNLSPYASLRDDLNIYQKYAVLTTAIHDSTPGTPNRLLKVKLETPSEKINLQELIESMGWEKPVRPIDESHKYIYYKKHLIEYSKIEELPGYNKERFFHKKVYPKKVHELRYGQQGADVYFNTFNELRRDPTIPYGEARARAFEAYKKALEIYNEEKIAEAKAKNDLIYKTNGLLLERHKEEIALKNKAKREYLHNEYLKKFDEYNKWWEDIKELAKTMEQFEATKPQVQLMNAMRVKASKMLYTPEYYVSKKSSFRRIYEGNSYRSILGYNDTNYSKQSYIDHIYMSEERGVVGQARELYDAIQEVNQDVMESTRAFKVALERPKTGGQFRSVYAPGMQRHATLGMSLINLNNKILDVIERFKDTPELDAFLSCDKQVVNNLEDLCLKQVLSLQSDSLTSFVHHQGKGIVVIPIGKYLTDTTAHNFDLVPDIKNFLQQSKTYESDILGVKRSGDNIILYIKNYKFHVKQQDIPYEVLSEISFYDAFKAAYGYPTGFNLTDIKEAIDNLKVKIDPNSFEYQQALDNTYSAYAKKYNISSKQTAFLVQHYEDIENLRTAYQEHYNSLKTLSLDYDHQYSYRQGGYGRTIDFDTYKNVLDQYPEVRRAMELTDDLELEKIYNENGSSIFNFTTLGRANYRLDLEPYASSNYQSVMANTYRSMAYSLSAATQYAQFYFEDSPWTLKNFFQYAKDDNEILVALKATDGYTVSTLHMNNKGLPIVKEIKINSVEDLRMAMKNNAILTPTTTFGSISQTLNNKRWSSSKFKIFHKIAYYAKMAMLVLNPGFIFRNIIDSTLKNILIADNKNAVLSNYLEAMDLHVRYQETIDLLFAINKEHPFRPDVMEIVFNDSTCPLTEQQFMFIHNFYENGPSAGSINRVADYYLQQSINKGNMQPSLLQRAIDSLMKPTKDIEDITRFTAYIEATKRGLTNVDAFELIRKTHFDYGTKTNTQHILELVFPFYSFKLKNFEFWLDFMSRSPSTAYQLLQLTTADWNWEDIDFDRIEYYQSQLNHITQANLKLNEQGLTLKINPSIMDPVNLMLNPLEALSGSVAPWVQPIVNAIQEKEPYGYDKLLGTTAGAALATVPGMGVAGMTIAAGSQYASRLTSGIRSYQRTGSVLPLALPSVFGSVKTPAQYGKASYTNSRAYMDPARRIPRRVNIYNKYYTDTGKNRWKIRFYPIDAATVQYRIRDNYNRFR